jgi:two-component system KDP operon response regulator KdpE
MEARLETLIVESYAHDRTMVRRTLEQANHVTTTVATASDALELLRETPFDVVFSALELDGGPSGVRVAQAAAWRWPEASIIIAGDRKSFERHTTLSDLGVDAHLLKPLDPSEVLRAVRKASARHAGQGSTDNEPRLLWCGSLVLCERNRAVALDGEEIDLTPTEFRLLRCLMENAHRVVSAEELLSAARGHSPSDFECDTGAIRWHVHQLRQKVEVRSRMPTRIVNVYGRGYTLAEAY